MGFIKAFSIYTFSGILNRGISFLLLPFFTHHLSQADYGVITIFSNSMFFIIPFMSMGVGETLTVEYPTLSKEELRKFISTSLVFPASVFLISSLMILIFNGIFTQLTGLSTYLLFMVCVLSVFNFLTEYLFVLFRNENKPLSFAMLSIGKTVIELSLAIYLISVMKQGYMGRVNSILVSSAAGFIVVLIYVYRNKLFVPGISKAWLNVILKRGLPAVPFFLMLFVLNNTDNYFINYYHGKNNLGPYGLACQVAMIINLIATSFVTPFFPFLYKNLLEKKYERILKVMIIYIGIMILSVAFLSFVAPYFFKVFIAEKFNGSLNYILLLSLGQMWWAFFVLFLGYLYFKKENQKLYYISICTICFTLVTDYLIIKESTTINWAWANMLSFLFCLLSIMFIYRERIVGVYRFIKLNRKSIAKST